MVAPPLVDTTALPVWHRVMSLQHVDTPFTPHLQVLITKSSFFHYLFNRFTKVSLIQNKQFTFFVGCNR